MEFSSISFRDNFFLAGQPVRNVNTPTFNSYSKINLSTLEKIRNLFIIVFTLGIVYLVQQHRFQAALKSGDLNTAESTLRWCAKAYLSRKDILDLVDKNQPEPLKFLVAQIDEVSFRHISINKDRTAEAFLSARDDHLNGQHPQLLLNILPYAQCPRSYLITSYCYGGQNDDYVASTSYHRTFKK